MFNPFAPQPQEAPQLDTTTKQGRLVETLSNLIEALPIPPQYQMIAKPLTGQLVTSCQALQESDVEDMLSKFRGYIDYVEHGND